jgi:hypothetical protein
MRAHANVHLHDGIDCCLSHIAVGMMQQSLNIIHDKLRCLITLGHDMSLQ